MKFTRFAGPIAACSAFLVACPADAAEDAQFLNAPATSLPTPKFAAQFQLRLRLPEGRGLARLLLDAGVSRDDAGAAARLAAGHLGAGVGGCTALVSIERSAGTTTGFSLVRVQLVTDATQTVIERRGRDLVVASDTAARGTPRLV